MKRWNTKKAGLFYGLALFSYTSYALLDTFVIPHPMQTVMASNTGVETNTGIKESIEAEIQEKLEPTSSTVEGGTVIGSYSDSNVSITLKEYREYDSAIYVADVTVSDVSYLKTALASNTYGRNITDTTSNIASDNNAILAINGDYYGARQSGYVIRNGSLYRNSSGNRDALAIMNTGEFEFVTEGGNFRRNTASKRCLTGIFLRSGTLGRQYDFRFGK